jgi:amidase
MDNPETYHNKLSRRRAIGLLGFGIGAIQFPIGCTKEKSKEDSLKSEPIHYMTLTKISKMIKTKEISSVDLTQLMLNRIATVDKKLNSYLTVFNEAALATARKLDKELESGKYRGPLHGVPIAVKDLLYTTNAPTTGGHAFKTDFVPTYNATVVNKLHEAGAVILGKTNLTEGAMAGYHPHFKIPVNPWGPFHPGESSSGSGVATAAGLCFGSIGTDTGGSIREPALMNGIVGLKPTYGLVSRYGVMPLAESMDHVGPITRSIEDAAIMLQAIAGYDPNDPTSLQTEIPDITGSLKKGIKGVRIGVDHDYLQDGVEPWLSLSIQSAINKLADLGARILTIKIPSKKEEWDAAWYTICAKEAIAAHKETYPSRRDEYGNFFRDFLDYGKAVSEEQYATAMQYREDFSNKIRNLFSEVDIIATPTGGIPKAPSEEVMRGPMTGWDPYLADFDWYFTELANLVGIPALSLPCGVANEGPPPGIQLMGDKFSEPLLCRVGYALEQGTTWLENHPKI